MKVAHKSQEVTSSVGVRKQTRTAKQTNSATRVRALSIQSNKESQERSAAQGEIKIENDKCGPETDGKNLEAGG